MFTGIIEELGRVRNVERRGEGVRVTIEARTVTEGTSEGDSIAVNGVCLTALDVGADSFAADGSRETLQRSTLGNLRSGSPVNLERAVTPATRLGGHIVQGHVDGTGTVESVVDEGSARRVTVAADPDSCRYVVDRGSVALDGVSLTAVEAAAERFTVALIPETLARTTLGDLRPGDSANVEVDLIAKYVARLAGGLQPTLALRGPE